MHTLVTGGAGYIGSHLVDKLVHLGNEVTVLDDLSTGSLVNLSNTAKRHHFIQGSILNEHLVNELVSQCDVVYHLAAAVGVTNIAKNPLTSLITNTRGADHVITAAYEHDVRLVLASTSEIYGKSPSLPMREDGDRLLGSTSIHRWGYSTAKALDEHLALAYADAGLRMSIVRYFNSYGPRLDPRGYGSVIATFIGQALRGDPLTVYGDGTQTRCFTFIADTVEGTYLAGTHDNALGLTFNIGNDVEMSVNQIAQKIVAATNSTSSIEYVSHASRFGTRFEDTPRRVPDLQRSRSVLGFNPLVAFDEGLRLTLEWWHKTQR
jgi:UDP-glucose 4-epimerase